MDLELYTWKEAPPPYTDIIDNYTDFDAVLAHVTQTDRQTDRQTERQTDTQTDRQTDRQTSR